MRYFKDDAGMIRAYDGDQGHLILKSYTELTEAEVLALSAPHPLSQIDYESAIQSVMDDKSRELGYDSIFTAVTYADEPAVVKFQSEGAALRAWRSRCWEYAYGVLAQVESEAIQLPSLEDFINGVPKYE